MKDIRRPVLRYHGGKFGVQGRVADFIAARFPKHRVYVEPFGGGGSVLMRKPRSHAEVYNDRWDVVVNVFRVLRDPEQSAELERLLRLTPFSRTEFNECGQTDFNELPPVERARQTILRSFAGFGSASTNASYATGFRANSMRSGTVPAHDWANYPDVVPKFTDRLRGVVIENRDAIDVIGQHDTAETLVYADPPYVHATRKMNSSAPAYACELNDDGHRALAKCLHTVEGMVVLSGYPGELYAELFSDWPYEDFGALADGARERTERLWFNPAAWAARPTPPKQGVLL